MDWSVLRVSLILIHYICTGTAVRFHVSIIVSSILISTVSWFSPDLSFCDVKNVGLFLLVDVSCSISFLFLYQHIVKWLYLPHFKNCFPKVGQSWPGLCLSPFPQYSHILLFSPDSSCFRAFTSIGWPPCTSFSCLQLT